jgi:hypothetical protein
MATSTTSPTTPSPAPDTPAVAASPAPADGASISRVSCQLPTFWQDNPHYWFRNAESNFHLAGIGRDITKYHHVVKSLDKAAVRELTDILDDVALQTDYTTFKERVIARFSTTDEHKLRELLSQAELGDRTPSQLLRHMRSLAGANVHDKMLRTLWADKLPTTVQTCLAPHPSMPLDQLTVLADSVYDIVKSQRGAVYAAAAAPAPAPATVDSKLDAVLQRLEILEATRGSHRSRSQTRGDGTYRPRSASRNKPKDGVC